VEVGNPILFRGHCSLTIPPFTLPAGTNVFTASYAGNAVYGAGKASLTQLVQAGGTCKPSRCSASAP
jgi:hypothetical protein